MDFAGAYFCPDLLSERAAGLRRQWQRRTIEYQLPLFVLVGGTGVFGGTGVVGAEEVASDVITGVLCTVC